MEALKEQFDELGVLPSNDVLAKCLELSLEYGIDDPVDFVEQWMAFSVSYKGGAEPSIEYLKEFEGKELKNKKEDDKCSQIKIKPTSAGLKIYNNPHDEDEDMLEDDLLGNYVCVTPKADKKPKSKFNLGTPDVSKGNFSPVSYSPLTTSKQDQVESKKSGNVIYNFGNYAVASTASSSDNQPIKISINGFTSNLNDVKYLNPSIRERKNLEADRVYEVGQEIITRITQGKQNSQSESFLLSHCDEQTYEVVQCLGKIYYDDRKLDKMRVCTFVGFDENKHRRVKLDMSRVKVAAVFPGQICVIIGRNPNGNKFIVDEIFSERQLEPPTVPTKDDISSLNIVIASAPFSSSENLLFEFLDKLIVYCNNNKPDMMILTGSYLTQDSEHLVEIATSLDDHFEMMLQGITETVGNQTQIVVVASVDDINSSGIYPTPGYKLSRNYPNLHLVSDPCTINVNGVSIGLTSTDIFQHFLDAEMLVNVGGDKTRRIINYMLHQGSFYPLFPPRVPCEQKFLFEFTSFSKVPHVLVIPSIEKPYLRDINGCLCVNPGQLVDKTNTAGTFARLNIRGPDEFTKNISSYLSGQIVCI